MLNLSFPFYAEFWEEIMSNLSVLTFWDRGPRKLEKSYPCSKYSITWETWMSSMSHMPQPGDMFHMSSSAVLQAVTLRAPTHYYFTSANMTVLRAIATKQVFSADLQNLKRRPILFS